MLEEPKEPNRSARSWVYTGVISVAFIGARYTGVTAALQAFFFYNAGLEPRWVSVASSAVIGITGAVVAWFVNAALFKKKEPA
ncbi:MAG: hypothetical protein EXQ93_04400 [Alphaproteobacteria bacterium]|nr:hypothetical protein [Alphaproteobacteria bacterium]